MLAQRKEMETKEKKLETLGRSGHFFLTIVAYRTKHYKQLSLLGSLGITEGNYVRNYIRKSHFH
jgi:hypothetical protein